MHILSTGGLLHFDESVVSILKLGLTGLCFLLTFLGFYLLHREQGKEIPSKHILGSIKFFIVMSFATSLAVGGFALAGSQSDDKRLTEEKDRSAAAIAEMQKKQDELSRETARLQKIIDQGDAARAQSELAAAKKKVEELQARYEQVASDSQRKTDALRRIDGVMDMKATAEISMIGALKSKLADNQTVLKGDLDSVYSVLSYAVKSVQETLDKELRPGAPPRDKP